MSGQLAASLILKFTDQGSTAAQQALAKTNRALKETEGAAKSMSSNAVSAFQKMSSAREILGIRPEKAIQNEIRLTEAAYQRLASSGQASMRELSRAQDAMRQKVGELRRELDGVHSSSGRAGSALGRAMAVVGAGAAFKAVVGGPIGQTMGYDRQLANLANTAYAGQGIDSRRTGMRSLDAAIAQAVRVGGGTREGALGTLDKLVASGAFGDANEAMGLLPILTRGGTAANADAAQLADIAIRGKQTFGLTNASLAIDQAMKAGQLGGFELKDMAKWLPQQMAMGRQSGLRGEEGFRILLAANQASAITAGTKDEAGNNLVNLLQKINSRDTAMDAKRLGIDLPGTLAAARGKGVNSLDAFVNMAEQIAGGDKNFVSLRAKAASAKGSEKGAAYESMADILQGSAIGKIVQDRQALMALLGIMNNRGYMNEVRGQLGNAQGTAGDAFSLISETPSFKAEQLAAEKAISMQVALDKVNPLLGGMADGITGLMRDFPALSAALVGTSLAVAALGAAAFAASGALLLMGGGKGGGAIAEGGKRLVGGAGAGLGWLGRAGVAAAPLAAIYGVSEWASDTSNDIGRAEGLRGTSGLLQSLFGDPTAGARARYEAQRADLGPQVIQVQIDGKTVATAVNEQNAQLAGRH